MKVLLIQVICLTGLLSITGRASEAREAIESGHQEESGVLTHGTILKISNGQIIVLTSGCLEPTRYSHGEGTVYVDESGSPITLRVVKSGVPVTVFYSQAEDQRIANRVIVEQTPPIPTVLIDC